MVQLLGTSLPKIQPIARGTAERAKPSKEDQGNTGAQGAFNAYKRKKGFGRNSLCHSSAAYERTNFVCTFVCFWVVSAKLLTVLPMSDSNFLVEPNRFPVREDSKKVQPVTRN
jgi:hypothetical protein